MKRKLKQFTILLQLAIVISLLTTAVLVFLSLSHPHTTLRKPANNKTTEKPAEKSKEPVDTLADRLDPPPVSGSSENLSVPILMYHHVSNVVAFGDKFPNLTVSDLLFDSQLRYLESRGYQTITLTDMYRALYFGQALPKKPVIITFDDGYLDNYNDAFPIIKKHKMKGEFFVITGSIGKTDFQRFNDYEKNSYLSESNIKEMSTEGMEMLPHTVDHPDLTGANLLQTKAEISESKKAMEDITGKHAYFFAYPFGRYTKDTIQILKDSGFYLALGTDQGNATSAQNPFELKRWYVGAGYNLSSILE